MLNLFADAAEEDHVYAFNDEVAARENAEEAGEYHGMDERINARANNEDRNDQRESEHTAADHFSCRESVDYAGDAAGDQSACHDIQQYDLCHKRGAWREDDKTAGEQ